MKKLLAMAATALLSMNASAGYVQYDLTGPVFGRVIQHEDNGSIAYYNLQVKAEKVPFFTTFSPLYDFANIDAVSTHFPNGSGPTNFAAYVSGRLTEYYHQAISLTFSRGRAGTFEYVATYSQEPIWDLPPTAPRESLTLTFTGLATLGTVPDNIARGLDEYGGYPDGIRQTMPRFIGPNPIPEPGSLALLVIGALGAARLRKRRQSA